MISQRLIAVIPPPPIESIGPIRIYGIMMAIAIGAGAMIAHRRYSARYEGSAVMLDLFLPTVIAGVVGARVYHLFTGYNWTVYGFWGIFNLRNGGLSIWGAVAFGAIAVLIFSKVKKLSFISLGAAIVPGLLIAQAIGRWGNYFNQELFGRELHAFWALKVDPAYRPAGMEHISTYHPVFLYEMLWCLALAVLIVLCEKKVKSWSEKHTIAFYVMGYCAGRVIWESIRIDQATTLGGIRFNLLVSMALCFLGTLWFVVLLRNKHDTDAKTIVQ